MHLGDPLDGRPDGLEPGISTRSLSIQEYYRVGSLRTPARDEEWYDRTTKTDNKSIDEQLYHPTIRREYTWEEVVHHHHHDREECEHRHIREEKKENSFEKLHNCEVNMQPL